MEFFPKIDFRLTICLGFLVDLVYFLYFCVNECFPYLFCYLKHKNVILKGFTEENLDLVFT